MEPDSRLDELTAVLTSVHEARPRASLLYARVVLTLIVAPDRTMALSDLSEAVGRGRDSSSVQQVVAHLAEAGLVTRDLVPAEPQHGRKWLVQLVRPKPRVRRRRKQVPADAGENG